MVAPYTMTSKVRVVSLEAAVQYVCACVITGYMVECGVAAGGSVMAMALMLLDVGKSDRGRYRPLRRAGHETFNKRHN